MFLRTKAVFSVAAFLLPPLAFAADFPSSCFVETSEFVPRQPGNVTVSTDWRDDLFFLQNGTVLPAAPKNVTGNVAIAAKLVDAPNWKGADFSKLQDASEETYVEIPPSVRAEETVRLTFDFGKTLPRETFRLVSSVVWGRYSVEASSDGKTYFETDERSVSRFDLRSVRLVFPPAPEQSAITTIRSFRFLSVSKDVVFVRAEWTSPISAYRSYRCDAGNLSAFAADRDGKISDVSKLKPSDNPTVPVFKGNPVFAQDVDSDGTPDSLDNCPNVANPSQSDRNFDGRGDACSDDDSDGRRGSDDNCPTVSNPKQTDANRNGVGDECEFDTDKDGVPDWIDNAIHVSNADQSDKDGDRIGDVIDNCELPNADQLDLDKNGKGDVCDRDFEYRNANDTDKDGSLDSVDNCEKIPNANQKDSDADGKGDACDNCPAIVNEDQLDLDKNGKGDACEDSDNDGIEGWRDNCVSVSNADQKDSNNDRVGDVCSDTDGDKVYDGSDVCPAAYDPDQEDVDSDGKWNACDAKDDRALESNRTVFAVLAVVVALAFLSGIGWVFVTMSKNPKSE